MAIPIHKMVTLTDANTEYSIELTKPTGKIQLQLLGAYDLRYSYEPGKVATPTEPYFTLKAGSVYSWELLRVANGLVVYFACGTAGQKVQLEYAGE